jgi:hypothetical protein
MTTTNGLAAGTYYINVDNGSGAVGYTLNASVIPPLENNDPEVNDDVANASPVLSNVTTEGHINYRYNGGSLDGNDYYELTTHSSGTLSLAFEFKGSDAQFAYFWLYQSNGTTLISGTGPTFDYGTAGATVSDFGNLAAGTYYIRVDGGSGAAGYKMTNNFCPDEIVIEALGETVVCEGDYVTLSTPDNHWSYLWSTGATTSTINAVLSDDYSLTIDNGNGCVRTSNTITVEVEPAPSADVIADGPTTLCEGGSVMLSVDFEADAYLWSNGETTPSITVSEGGEYYVALTKGNCVGESQPILITVNPIPSATITAQGSTTFCDGGSVTLNAPAGNDSYLWSTGATGSSIVADATGEYSCVVTDNGCSATSNVISVTENPYPVVMIEADGPTEFCSGESVMLSASGADSYSWNTGATSSSITVGSSGDYTVTGTTNGCSSVSNTITVTVTPCGDVTIEADGPTEFCDGGSVMLTSSEASGNVWSTGETTQSIVVTGSGDYSVTVNGNTSNTISVTVNPNPAPEISATGATEFCEGGSVELISEGSYASYQWSTGETSSSVAVSESGNYSVTVTDANGCSGTSNVIHVDVQPNPSVEVTAGGPTEFCLGHRVKLMAASNGDVQWYYNGEAVEPPYGQSPVLNAGRTGSYWAMASIGSCTTTSNSIEVTVNGSKVSVQPKGPVNICEADGETAILKANVADSGATIRWRRDGSLIAGAFGQYYTVSKAGTYEAVAIYDGCNTLSNSVLVKNACRAGAAMEAAISNWSVYPNPTESGSVMEFQSAISGSAMLRIMDAGGRVLHMERFEVFTGSNMKLINLGAMSAGLYQIQLIGPDGSAVQQTIVRVE